ncbi:MULTISPECIES: DUF1801 domain-containing protein [Listeria]|uniref:DUF1801 domain-containing protein n=1 Tax=Listeria TaxID=1637 RepID=UPI000B597040|nr:MULTISPECIES: DUF1801 domain-containing protein [Listeria]
MQAISVKEKYATYTPLEQAKLLEIRSILFEVAALVDGDAVLEEDLKWGQPSYALKGGTPIRLDTFSDGQVAMFFHCQTNLIENFRTIFGNELYFSGNRAIVFDISKSLPEKAIQFCAEAAFTYHKKK